MKKNSNLVFILTDQQRFDTLAAYGNQFVQAPHLNRLAAEGLVFENAYVTQPVCTPSRSSIITGLYPHTTGCIGNNIPLKPETPSIAQMVSPDYRRAYVGKWHLGDEVMPQHGFETWVSIMDRYRPHYSRPDFRYHLSDYYHFLVENGFEPDKEHHGARIFSRRAAARMPEPYTKARFVGQEAARFLREIGQRPFILYVSFFEPHPPIMSPLDDLYVPEEVPVGPHFRRPPPEDAAWVSQVSARSYALGRELFGVDVSDELGWRRLRARYLGMITLVDRAVGDIMAALDESGLRDRTIVVFTSDHGEMLGDHGLFQKGFMYEESVKVPLLMRVPWLAAPRRISRPVSQIDLVPTLLDLLGQPIPEHLQGKSWAPGLGAGQALTASEVVIEWNGARAKRPSKWLRYAGEPPDLDWERADGPWRSIVSADGFKLNMSPMDRCELHDLNSDPHERANLFGQSGQRERVRDLAARLCAWQERSGDTAPLTRV